VWWSQQWVVDMKGVCPCGGENGLMINLKKKIYDQSFFFHFLKKLKNGLMINE